MTTANNYSLLCVRMNFVIFHVVLSTYVEKERHRHLSKCKKEKKSKVGMIIFFHIYYENFSITRQCRSMTNVNYFSLLQSQSRLQFFFNTSQVQNYYVNRLKRSLLRCNFNFLKVNVRPPYPFVIVCGIRRHVLD